MTHLLTGCSFSRVVWYEVLSWIRSTSGPPTVEGDFTEWWSLVVRTARHQLRKGISSIIMLTTWWIRKHRNVAVFDNALPSVTSLFNNIRFEARQWADAGVRGVRQLLPRLVSSLGLSCKAWCVPSRGFVHITSFYQCIKTQFFCVFAKKN
jgi:hypothetical protein